MAFQYEYAIFAFVLANVSQLSQIYKGVSTNTLCMTYTTCIVPYLSILGQFDAVKMREIEQDLIDALKKVDCSEARYRRFKTDRDHSTPLHHLEAEAIYEFFYDRFNQELKKPQDERMIETLEAWMPSSTLNIYWKFQPVKATG